MTKNRSIARQSVSSASEKPIYARIVSAIRQDLSAGILEVGDMLPTEETMCKRFGVSRHTVREALRLLREEGLIESRQGAGSRVLTPPLKPIYTHSVASIDELLQFATDVRYQISKSAIVLADADVASKLGCEAGSRWLRVEGFRSTQGQDDPVCWTEVFVAAEFAGIGLMIGRKSGTIYSFIEEMYDVRVEKVEQTLEAALMPEAAGPEMRCAPLSAATLLRRKYYLADGVTALIALNYHVPERLKMSWTLRRGS